MRMDSGGGFGVCGAADADAIDHLARFAHGSTDGVAELGP